VEPSHKKPRSREQTDRGFSDLQLGTGAWATSARFRVECGAGGGGGGDREGSLLSWGGSKPYSLRSELHHCSGLIARHERGVGKKSRPVSSLTTGRELISIHYRETMGGGGGGGGRHRARTYSGGQGPFTGPGLAPQKRQKKNPKKQKPNQVTNVGIYSPRGALLGRGA